jgi:fatty-acyl-CoA synthase
MDPRTTLTYRGLAQQAHQYSRWAIAQGIRPGDTVCLLLRNCAAYPAIWLGVTHVGGIVALLNTNLKGKALAHSIDLAGARHIILEETFIAGLRDTMPKAATELQCWILGPGNLPASGYTPLAVSRYANTPLDRSEAPMIRTTDRALYIYTSGTTGFPKAANISHFRLLEWSYWFAGMMDIHENDRMYDCLPMYHSTGGIVAIGALLVQGGSVVVRDGFSVSRFWQDIVENGCTLFQYIGELCRYLLNGPPDPYESGHQLRLSCGNGLRGDVWTAFQQRFRIPQILEFYASTEGNVSLYNCEGKTGAIGRIPPFLATRFPVALIKCDEAGKPLRDDAGFCIRVPVGETGEAIGRIAAGSGAQMSAFDGYTDDAASKAKVLRDVFAHGDAWFRTGDLMRQDPAGFFYFVDRTGDTFRWKGENVSTAQVAEVIHGCPGVTQAVVYGVAVPNAEGKAGMAAIVAGSEFDPKRLWNHINAHLPECARPLFLRLSASVQTTSTFKPLTARLAAEGCDPDRIGELLYFNDRTRSGFVPLDHDLYCGIERGDIRL